MNRLACALALLVPLLPAAAQEAAPPKKGDELFRQLERELPTPTATRAASGAPGHRYWQQRVDYEIAASLDEATHKITGMESITYTNNSPDTLRYLWVQLDQNTEAKDAENLLLGTTNPAEKKPGKTSEKSFRELGYALYRQSFKGGYQIHKVTNASGRPLRHLIRGTMMRIDLDSPLAPKGKVKVGIAWTYNVRNISHYSTRTGYEFLPQDEKNPIYTIAHWYPRMAAYSDRHGWHVHHYLGEEFALEFGDFEVSLLVPTDYVVAATGELQNAGTLLSPAQQKRLEGSRAAPKAVYVVTPEEAKARETARAGAKTKARSTWKFKAKNVRDFAWAASRKYIWDAKGVKVGENTVMAMSYYPNEAAPLWSKYSTEAVAHTLEHYSKYLPYPYPVALSCNGAVGGMEHPMISFQRARPEEDGTYSRRTKYGLISVIIHEVGHNWFPMIVNNDERRWRWMDEGFNSFVQQVAEGYWEKDYPSRNDARRARVLDYMASADDQPIMTNTSLLLQGGANAYSKTALALTLLRESVLGREVFDFAFSEYCRRWAFKRPMPGDFFRTMEDASGQDLDWFFRGWFFSTDHVDLAITDVRELQLETGDPEIDKPRAKAREEDRVRRPRQKRNLAQPKRTEGDAALADFYSEHDPFAVTPADRKDYEKLLEKLKPHERELLKLQQRIYVIDFENKGGLAMPMPLTFHYADGTTSQVRLPATLWRRSVGGKVSKLFLSSKAITRVVLDAEDEMADVDMDNNAFPQRIAKGTLKLTKDEKKPNAMQQKQKAEEEAAKKAAEEAEEAKPGAKPGEKAAPPAKPAKPSGGKR